MRRATAVLVAAIAVVSGTGAEAAEPDLQTLAEALAAPRVVGPVTLEGPIEVGRARITPAAGATVYALAAAGVPCGLWVKGPAELTYRVEDRFSRPVALRNLRSATRLRVAEQRDAVAVTAELEEAVLWGWDLPAPGTGGPADGSAPSFSPGALEVLERSLGSNPVRDMLLARFNGQADYRYAILRTASEDLTLDVDGRPHVRTEWLARTERLRQASGDYAGRAYSMELSAQPIGRNWWDPVPRPFAITEIVSDVKVGEGPRARVRARQRVTSLVDGLQLLAFSVPEHVVDDDGQLRPVTLHAVSSGGAAIPFVRHRAALLVALPRALAAGNAVLIETDVEGDFALRPGQDVYWTMGMDELAPAPGDNGAVRASHELSVEAPTPFKPFASGVTRSRSSQGGKEILTTQEGGQQKMGPVLVAGNYQTVTAERAGYTVYVSSYGQFKKAEAERLANNFFAAKECLEQWFGQPYPFKEVDVVEINSWGFGVAPPGVIYVTRELFSSFARTSALAGQGGEEGFLAAATSRGANERFMHEVAHGFFPHLAYPEGVDESWLSESFAEYASAVCAQRTSASPRDGEDRFRRAVAEWKSRTRNLGAGTSVFLADHFAGEQDQDYLARAFLVYGKGPLVLHAIRQELGRWQGDEAKGDQYFFAFLRAVVRNFSEAPVGTRHVVGILDQMTERDWQPFFERYVYGTETPDVR